VTDVDAQVIYAGKGNGKIPALQEAANRWVFEELENLYPGLNLNVLVDAVPYNVGGRSGEAFPDWRRVAPILDEAFATVFSGEKPAYQALMEAKPVIEAILNQ